MTNRISGSIVLYNNPIEELRQAIESFLQSEDADRLYLVDNSPMDDLKVLSGIDKRIVYIFNPSNPGFGAAHNIALKDALSKDFKYHLVLNPDVYYHENVIESLADYLDDNPTVGNIMPKVLYPDGSVQYLAKLLPTPYDWIGRRFNPFKGMTEKRNELFELRFTGYDKIMNIPYLSGCFMFLKLDIIKKVGLFDERIFMYGEETDLCRRIIDAGFQTVFYPKVTIYHHFKKGSHKSLKLTKIGMESAIYYFNKWGWFFDRKRDKINNDTLNLLQR